jgi:omega-amidase
LSEQRITCFHKGDKLMQQPLRIALLQMDVVHGDPDANFRRAQEMIEEVTAAQEKPDVIVMPEMWNTGYSLANIKQIADVDGQRTKQVIGDLARQAGVHIVAGSVANLIDGDVYNTIFAFDRQGEVQAQYSKIHLFRLLEEEKYLKAGNQLGKLNLDGTQAGMMICYDIRFPELSRRLALDGAKLLIVPAEWPHPRLHHWRSLLIARAIENQMYVCAVNCVGSGAGNEFFGHSMVIDPWGEVLAEADEQEQIVQADINLALVDEVRERIPVFNDRRPEMYG